MILNTGPLALVHHFSWRCQGLCGLVRNPAQVPSRSGRKRGAYWRRGTLSLIGDMKEMSTDYIKAAVFHNYGISLFVGVGIPIPILDEEMVAFTSVEDKDIYTWLYDYSVPRRDRPALAKVNYKDLRSGEILVNGKRIPTAPLSSLFKAREIANKLKEWIQAGFPAEPTGSASAKNKKVNPLTLGEEE